LRALWLRLNNRLGLISMIDSGCSRNEADGRKERRPLHRRPNRLRTIIMKLPRRKFLHLAASAVVLPALSHVASAQAYPTRPVRIIVPFAAGGGSDVIARLVAQKLTESLGKQFYVENQVGAGGNLGMGNAAKAAPDGHTILFV